MEDGGGKNIVRLTVFDLVAQMSPHGENPGLGELAQSHELRAA